jgi:hypothetical protein
MGSWIDDWKFIDVDKLTAKQLAEALEKVLSHLNLRLMINKKTKELTLYDLASLDD